VQRTGRESTQSSRMLLIIFSGGGLLPTSSGGFIFSQMQSYRRFEMSMTRPSPNHALQRTRPSRRGCNRGVPCAGSLSLGRSATERAGKGRMLLPIFAVVGWAVVGLSVGGLLVYRPHHWPIWCGLGAVACGIIYYWAVMNAKPPLYYPALELLAAGLSLSVGAVGVAAYGIWLWSPLPPDPPEGKNAEPDAAADPAS
jgi:hypothetical protein